ncbi:Retrovirus-related Pol polyprotein from transposon RE1 [Vitis vinifera]|uniref:Retrovirus-related Pol polyprotein from transposon RE1 n=1 Tax=Vitis vinifera TaxID=29760 RepID=A0A438CU85_VITVI|nr:Retrovirus-related Pol polyprotein from transposon RE1 [Vitis vinifera]
MSEALSHPRWRQAMVDEMTALHSNGTWDLVSLPPGKSTVGCRWVYTVKVGPDGQVDRLKARLVAKVGYKNVFLHGELLEEMCMEQPLGFVAQGESGLVCKLRRSLYGLNSLIGHGSDQEGIPKTKAILFNHFQTKDLGKLKYFLGLEIAQSSLGVVMSQRRGAFKRSWEISTTCRQIELPHHHSARHLFPMSVAKVCCMKTSYTQIVGYIDADWAGSPSDRRSTSGHTVKELGIAISLLQQRALDFYIQEISSRMAQ